MCEILLTLVFFSVDILSFCILLDLICYSASDVESFYKWCGPVITCLLRSFSAFSIKGSLANFIKRVTEYTCLSVVSYYFCLLFVLSLESGFQRPHPTPKKYPIGLSFNFLCVYSFPFM